MKNRIFRAAVTAGLSVLATLALTVPAFAADPAYLIHDHADPSRAIFSISDATESGSSGTLTVAEGSQRYSLPIYRADPDCSVLLEGSAAQLRVFPVTVSSDTGTVDWTDELMPDTGKMTVTLKDGTRSIAAKDFEDYIDELTGAYTHQPGAGYTLTEPGYYLVSHSTGGLAPSSVIVRVNGTIAEKPQTPVTPVTPSTPGAAVTASQNRAPVLVNGKTVLFDAYTIREPGETNGYTYFKLRDIAAALSGTSKQYEVVYDKASGAVLLLSGMPYTLAGGELTAGAAGDQTATPSASPLYKDGLPVGLTAYTIRQNNYFKLRDLGQLFDFSVSWDNDAMCIVIDTNLGYTE